MSKHVRPEQVNGELCIRIDNQWKPVKEIIKQEEKKTSNYQRRAKGGILS